MRKVKLPKMNRFQFLGFNNRVTIRTFNKDVYILKSGLIVQNVETNQVCRLEQIYYDIRTVRTITGKIVAKRKNRFSDLYKQEKIS
ncbi:hypothetical protein MPH61_23360 [Peribacillus muralis]|uniref:hypothetical protein n=1 Tax=Peribacillus muralis TaxID=264697 RepID=UPI001F4E474B|nr:hypothetical protein [Peribacillus muralis]MCK1995464.1 hypothetical protein [Peribacillus muralis]MCK2016047.1 hypothetical protein [Peribacillus muralis]